MIFHRTKTFRSPALDASFSPSVLPAAERRAGARGPGRKRTGALGASRGKTVLPAIQLARVLRARRPGKVVVFTNGCFDLVHAGHLKVLEWAKRRGHLLVVGLNSDASVRRLKGDRRPILPLADRAALMAALKPVDFVTWFSEETPRRLIRLLRPDVLVKGGDWAAASIAGREFVKKVVRVPLMKGRSTSGIISTIVARYGAPSSKNK